MRRVRRAARRSPALACPGTHLRSSEAGAEEAQQGVLSTIMITLMPAAAASATRRSVQASARGSIAVRARWGSSTDQGTSMRTTFACSACAQAIARSIAGVAAVAEAADVHARRAGADGRASGAPAARRAGAGDAAAAGPAPRPARGDGMHSDEAARAGEPLRQRARACRHDSARAPRQPRPAARDSRAVGCLRSMSPTWIWMQVAIVVFVLIGMIVAITKLA